MRPADVARLARFARGVHRYARADLSRPALRAALAERLATRDERFLAVLRDGVYARPSSPYLALLRHAGVEEGDVVALVRARGVDGALAALYDAGVTVGADEVRGRAPIVRPGLELHVRDTDFDNPMLENGFRGTTGGSTGAPRRTVLDPADLVDESIHHDLWVESAGVAGRPLAVWRSVLPSRAGIRTVFRCARLGPRLEAWFTQTPPTVRATSFADWTALRVALGAARAGGRHVPSPVHVPVAGAPRVARWLADRVAEGRAPVLDAPVGACVRAVVAARDAGLDIGGTLVRCGGEPFTEAKLALVEAAGAGAASHYSMAEVSRIAISCDRPSAPDDSHFLSDKLALLPRPAENGTAAILLTTLARHTSKLFLNVDTGDTAVVEERACGCLVGDAGLTLHLHTIRSPEKLTSEGVTFQGGDVLGLVETVLPARLGGGPTDYQIVEREVGGVPRIALVVSPRVGEIDEEEAVRIVLGALAAGPSYRRMMATTLAEAGTVQVERSEPFASEIGKVPALHKAR
jgi:hypothetical protein